MSDLKKARAALPGHSVVLVRGETVYVSDLSGVAPLLKFGGDGVDLRGFAAADKIVGRAAAFLFIRAGVSAVHAAVLSEGARDLLAAHGVPVTWETLTPRIVNRAGTGVCPMEEAVTGVTDPETAFARVSAKAAELAAGSTCHQPKE